MKVINLFAGPSCGKSQTAAGLFYQMKCRGLNVELVSEYAKDMVWEKRANVLDDQLYILAKQNRKLLRLKGQADWVVTDSPVLLGWFYTPSDYYPHFKGLIRNVFDSYDNHSFFLGRDLDIKYQVEGRIHDLSEGQKVDNSILHLLDAESVPYTTVSAKADSVEFILNSLGIV